MGFFSNLFFGVKKEDDVELQRRLIERGITTIKGKADIRPEAVRAHAKRVFEIAPLKQPKPAKTPFSAYTLPSVIKERAKIVGETFERDIIGAGISGLEIFVGGGLEFADAINKLLEKKTKTIKKQLAPKKGSILSYFQPPVKKTYALQLEKDLAKEKIGEDLIAKIGLNLQKEARVRLERNPNLKSPAYFTEETWQENLKKRPVEYMAHITASQTPTFLSQMAVSLTSGGMAALAYMGLGEAGGKYKEAKEAGKPEMENIVFSSIYGGVVSKLEQIGMGKILKPAAIKKIAKGYLKGIVSTVKQRGKAWIGELGTESAQNFVDNFSARWYDKNRPLFEGEAETVLGTLGLGGLTIGTQTFADVTKGKQLGGLSIEDVSGKGLQEEAKKAIAEGKSMEEFVDYYVNNKSKIPISADKIPEGAIKTHIGEKGLKSQLTDIWNKAQEPVKLEKKWASSLGEKAIKGRVIKQVEFTDKTIRDTQTGKTAPSGVLLGERKLVVNSKELGKDLNALISNDKNLIQSRDLEFYVRKPKETDDQLVDRYIREIIEFEETHIKTGTIGEALSLYTGIFAKKTAKKMDERAIKIREEKPPTFEKYLETEFPKIEADIESRMVKLEQKEADIIQAIKNNPYYRKEKAVKDEMGEGWLMKNANGRRVIVEAGRVQEYSMKGYDKILEVDSLAQEAGFDNGLDFLEHQIELSEVSEAVDIDRIARKQYREQYGEIVPRHKKQRYLKKFQQDIINKIKRKLSNKAYIKSITKKETLEVQTELIEILEKSNLYPADKTKFIRAIKNIQTKTQLEKKLPKIITRIEQLEEQASKNSIRKQIRKELEVKISIKRGALRKGKYDYENNKIINTLKRYNKLNQNDALTELQKRPTENLTEFDLIKNRFLSYKANGSESSIAMVEQVLADIQNIKEMGKQAKQDADLIKSINKQEKADEVSKEILNAKGKKIFTKIKGFYIESIANLYSTINTIAGKKIADKYDYSVFETDKKDAVDVKNEEVINNSQEIYNVKNNNELTKIFIKDLAPKEFKAVDNDGLKYELSKFELMDIYNSIKNDLGMERYYKTFGEKQTNSLLKNLNDADFEFADYIMEETQKYKEIFNQHAVETTGLDMGTVDFYWPFSSRRHISVIDGFMVNSETPSAEKSRASSSAVKPIPKNAWFKFQKHINQGEHITHISRKYEELKRVFTNDKIENQIVNKHGQAVYNTLQSHIDTLSLNKTSEDLDTYSKVFGFALNNWVKAKIASPTVFTRQLNSMVYSIEKVSGKEWLKYNAELMKNPRKAFAFMWNNVPSIKARFKRGYSEAAEEAIRGVSALKIGMSSVSKYTTILSRTGDITAVIVNGYPIMKSELAKGKTMEEAIDVFKKFSEKTQQSGAAASLSRLQRIKNPLAKLFFRFKNSLNQFARLQADAIINYNDGSITKAQLTKTILLYSVYTPIMYVLMGLLVKEGVGVLAKGITGEDKDEEEKDTLSDVIENIILQPFKALPLLDATTEFAYKKMAGKTTYGRGVFSYPLLDDISTAMTKISKKEVGIEDIVRFFSLLQEPISGIPTETLIRYGKPFLKEKEILTPKQKEKVYRQYNKDIEAGKITEEDAVKKLKTLEEKQIELKQDKSFKGVDSGNFSEYLKDLVDKEKSGELTPEEVDRSAVDLIKYLKRRQKDITAEIKKYGKELRLEMVRAKDNEKKIDKIYDKILDFSEKNNLSSKQENKLFDLAEGKK